MIKKLFVGAMASTFILAGGFAHALERTSSTSGFNWGDDLSTVSDSIGGTTGQTASSSKIKSTHISDIREAITIAAQACGNVPLNVLYPSQDTQTLSMMGYPSKPLPALHINILRRAIEALYLAKYPGGTPSASTYFSGSVNQGERIQKAHIQQMRRALDDLVVSCAGGPRTPLCWTETGFECDLYPNPGCPNARRCGTYSYSDGSTEADLAPCDATAMNPPVGWTECGGGVAEVECILGARANWSDLVVDYQATIFNISKPPLSKVLCDPSWTTGTVIYGTPGGCYSVQTGSNWYEYDCDGTLPVCEWQPDQPVFVACGPQEQKPCGATCSAGETCWELSPEGEPLYCPTGQCCGSTVSYSVALYSCVCGTTPPPAAVCGNGSCEFGETAANCPADCGTCFDGAQNQGETGLDCGGPCAACASGSWFSACLPCHIPGSSMNPSDCGASHWCDGSTSCTIGDQCISGYSYTAGIGSTASVYLCGTSAPSCGGVGSGGSSCGCSSNPTQCPCPQGYLCFNDLCNVDSAGVCGNGVCGDNQENSISCPADCGSPPVTCPNGVCDNGETCATCPGDCGCSDGYQTGCGNGACDSTEDCSICPSDCGACSGGSGGGGGPVLYCGDLVCNNGEDCSTCAGDCGPCGCGG